MAISLEPIHTNVVYLSASGEYNGYVDGY